MSTLINNNELLRICQYLTLVAPPFYLEVTNYLNDLYVTGCRATEPLLFNRWTWNTPTADEVTLTPLKLSHDRTFKKGMLSDSLLFAIENQVKPYGGLSLRQIEYSMRQVSQFGTVQLTDRNTIAYIYRYYKVRDLLNDGLSQAEVNTLFGWNNPTMSERYTDADLYVTIFDIPAETYYLSSWNNDTINDSDGTYIISE
jgi:hypothetical protein